MNRKCCVPDFIIPTNK